MASREQQPVFGYTFQQDGGDFLGGSPQNERHHLLSENENHLLVEFFANTDPYMALPQGPAPTFPQLTDTKDTGFDDFSWATDFVPPASVHGVSTTTMADQAHLGHGFHTEHALPSGPLSAGVYLNTPDEYQAAEALFSNAQASHANARSYSVPNMQNGHQVSNIAPSDILSNGFASIPLVNTPHGPLDEQLAALLPHHSEQGSVDELVASQFGQARRRQGSHLGELEQQRPSLKRTYTYGTDSAFNPTGYSAPEGLEEAVHERLQNTLRSARPLQTEANGGHLGSVSGASGYAESAYPGQVKEEGDGSGDQSPEDETNRPAKRRQKSKADQNGKGSGSRRKSTTARPTKNGKAPADEPASKKKRPSTAGSRPQRENLTEEQKRSNHILSEQKRRNLIKRGFDDLHELVPALRNAGLSKSAILMEVGDFLEKLVEGNNRYHIHNGLGAG